MAQTGAAKPGTGPGSATARSAVVFNKAMSVALWRPTISAGALRPSARRSETLIASPRTWSFVTT